MEQIKAVYLKIVKYLVLRKTRSYLYLSAFLIGVCLTIRGSEYLILLALTPMISYVLNAGVATRKQKIIDSYVFGFIVCAFANLFLFQISSANWLIYLSSWFTFFATFVSWILICSFCALAYLCIGFMMIFVKNNTHRLLILPFVFALSELARSYLFSIMAYGPHGSLSPNFNWGSIAVPASATGLVFSSKFVGFFGLTIFVLIVNICIFLIYSRKKIAVSTLLLMIVFVITYNGWSLNKDTEFKTPNIEFVHLGEKDSLVTWKKSAWPKQGTDLLVLPEYSEFLDNPEYKNVLSRLSDRGLVVTTIKSGRSPGGTNQMVYMNKSGRVISRQDKTFLIPTGETMPYVLQGVFKLVGKNNAVVDFTYTQQLTPGAGSEYSIDANGFKVGGLACSGVSALSEYSRLSDEGADVLVNSASLSFLKPNSLYHVYARNMARYHAVSNNKTFVQASRSGESYIIDNTGNIKNNH